MEKLFVNTWENKLVVNLLNCSGFWLSKDGKSISFYAIDPSSDPDNWDFQSKERGKEVYDALLDKHSTQL